MEFKYKIKYLLVVSFLFLCLFASINWYATINREHVDKISNKTYLSFDEAKNVAAKHDPERKYYFLVEYTQISKKTLIPFVYEKKPVTKVNKALMSKPI